MKALVVHALPLSGRTALPVILCCLLPSSLWCPSSFLGFLGGFTLFWVVRCLPIVLLGDRVFHILVIWDPLCCTRSWGPGYIVGFRRVKVPSVRSILYSTSWWVKDRGTYHGWLNRGLDCDTIHHKLVGERSWQMSDDTNVSLAWHVSKLCFVFY